MTKYYSLSNPLQIPKIKKEKVKIECAEFPALHFRPFEVISGDGFLKMAQSIFDAGKHFNPSSNVNVKNIIPSPFTVKWQIFRTNVNVILCLF